MAYKIPSMNKNRPNAMINSFIKIYSVLGFIFPKFKNSLSGDNIEKFRHRSKLFHKLALLYRMQKFWILTKSISKNFISFTISLTFHNLGFFLSISKNSVTSLSAVEVIVTSSLHLSL